MIHALVLGLVIAIILIILIQKTTSGFTAAECDARYTLSYRACGDTYEKAQKECGNGRNATSCKQKALRAKEACIDAAASAKITCLGPAAAAGDVVATRQLQDAQQRDERRSSPPAITGGARVTPGATFTPADAQDGRGRRGDRGDRGDRGGQGGPFTTPSPVAAPPPAPTPPPVAAPPPAPTPPPVAPPPPAPTPPPVAPPPPAPTPPPVAPPPPVPAPAEAPSALQMAPCGPGETETTFGGQLYGEGLIGDRVDSLRVGDPVCSKPLPAGQPLCNLDGGEIQHRFVNGQKECLKPRIA